MTTSEILWLVHTENVQRLRQDNPRKLRPYLIEMGDEVTLRQWDKEQMSAKSNN